jgi:signal transduction histidine kinase
MTAIFTNIAGLSLALMIVIHLWIITTIYRQNISSVFYPLYTYFNILFVILELCTIFFLWIFPEKPSLIVFKIHFIAFTFIPPILFYLSENYLTGLNLPQFNVKNIVIFTISVFFSALAIGDYVIDGAIKQSGMIFPIYGKIYWAFVIYLYLTLLLMTKGFLKKYQIEKREPEIKKLKNFLTIIIPGIVLAFTCLSILPLWGIIHPAILLCYVVFSLLILWGAFKFQIVEFDDQVSKSIFFFEISGLYVLLMSLLLAEINLQIYLLSIPLFILLLFIYHALLIFTLKNFKEQESESDYEFEDELEILISETEKYIDNQALSQFIGDLSLKVLRCTKCAVITSQFDIRPYQITYFNGYNTGEIEDLIGRSNSPFIETLEYNRVIVNKFDLNPQSALYQTMDRYNIYLGIPLVSENNLLGFILLGGERKLTRITKRDLKFARFLAIKSSHAFQNIEEIQSVVQSQKMADLGVVASQLAHDFQSFITLVKLETSGDEKLRRHANYMEKLVKDLLKYARPRDLRLSLVNINQLIDMTLDLLNFPPFIVIEKHYSESIPQINVDADQMRRVFLNLFENSLGAIRGGAGRIKVTTRPLRPLSSLRRNTWLYIEILDDGAGIPDDFLDKIFDPFFTTRKNEGGNGMGLAIVSQIISRHKGFIDVTSKLGKGTIFNIRLPYLR